MEKRFTMKKPPLAVTYMSETLSEATCAKRYETTYEGNKEQSPRGIRHEGIGVCKHGRGYEVGKKMRACECV